MKWIELSKDCVQTRHFVRMMKRLINDGNVFVGQPYQLLNADRSLMKRL